jgi:hypothetical protein
MTFFGVQGPWYTLGWTMATSVERVFGRRRLIEDMCDPRRLMRDYDAAAEAIAARGGRRLPLWSTTLLDRLDGRR